MWDESSANPPYRTSRSPATGRTAPAGPNGRCSGGYRRGHDRTRHRQPAVARGPDQPRSASQHGLRSPGVDQEELTVGVEEEYLLLASGHGGTRPGRRAVLAEAGRGNAGGSDLQPELVRAQVEIATPVCHELDEVQEALTAARTGSSQRGRCRCRPCTRGSGSRARRRQRPGHCQGPLPRDRRPEPGRRGGASRQRDARARGRPRPGRGGHGSEPAAALAARPARPVGELADVAWV